MAEKSTNHLLEQLRDRINVIQMKANEVTELQAALSVAESGLDSAREQISSLKSDNEALQHKLDAFDKDIEGLCRDVATGEDRAVVLQRIYDLFGAEHQLRPPVTEMALADLLTGPDRKAAAHG